VILAGDVGGTKTRLALYAPDAPPRAPLRELRAASRDYASLDALVLEFLGADRTHVTTAAFGIAGPVVGNRSETTNLPWTLDGDALGERLDGARVRLLNDLEATGWGIAELGPGDLSLLQTGEPSPGNRALIAAGTGLGEALLVWDGATHRPTASEGGHTDFGPRDALEDELNVWLRAKYGRVSYERVLSGPGLADLYRFFAETDRGRASPEVARRFATGPDPARIVTTAALDGSCERAALTLDLWVRIYGAEAGNVALKALAVDGIYVAGGIAPKVKSAIASGGFLEAFRSKGRLTPLLERIPVTLVLDDRVAVWGAAAYAMAHASPGVARRAS